MTYRARVVYIEHTMTEKLNTKTGLIHKYIVYKFRDVDDNSISVVYDHTNNGRNAELMNRHQHRELEISGRVTHHYNAVFLNLDRWSVLLDDVPCDPNTGQLGFTVV